MFFFIAGKGDIANNTGENTVLSNDMSIPIRELYFYIGITVKLYIQTTLGTNKRWSL